MSEDLVLLTLEELQEKGLLDVGIAEALPRGPSRREMIGKIGLATAALLPAVAAITAPPALAQGGSVSSGSRKRAKNPGQTP